MNTSNTKNTRRLFLASTLIGAMSLGSYAIAGDYGTCKHGKKGGEYSQQRMQKKMGRLADKLGLSEEQSEQMKAAMQNNRGTMKSFKTQMKTVGQQIRNLDPTAADFDTQLAALANQKAELTRQMTIAKSRKRKAMSQILTPAQREKMKEMRVKRQARHHKRYED